MNIISHCTIKVNSKIAFSWKNVVTTDTKLMKKVEKRCIKGEKIDENSVK